MSAYDEFGNFAQRPVRPEDWPKLCPNLPKGVIVQQEAAPPGFLVVQNFLAQDVCEKLTTEARNVTDTSRLNDMIDGVKMETSLIDLGRQVYTAVIGPHFRVGMEWFEPPHVLRVGTGGEQFAISDADQWDPTAQQWTHAQDRDLSVKIFLNEDYEGGEVVFSNFGFGLKPKAGLLIAHPADHRYLHMIQTVTSGDSFSIRTFGAAQGMDRTGGEPPTDAIRL